MYVSPVEEAADKVSQNIDGQVHRIAGASPGQSRGESRRPSRTHSESSHEKSDDGHGDDGHGDDNPVGARDVHVAGSMSGRAGYGNGSGLPVESKSKDPGHTLAMMKDVEQLLAETQAVARELDAELNYELPPASDIRYQHHSNVAGVA